MSTLPSHIPRFILSKGLTDITHPSLLPETRDACRPPNLQFSGRESLLRLITGFAFLLAIFQVEFGVVESNSMVWYEEG